MGGGVQNEIIVFPDRSITLEYAYEFRVHYRKYLLKYNPKFERP